MVLVVRMIMRTLESVVWIVWLGRRLAEGLGWVVDVLLHILGLG
jgi:hypothetical protein